MLDLGFGELGLHRIAALCVYDNNHSSAALLQRLGMRRVGHLLESALLDGAWVDQVAFGLGEHEWPAGHRSEPINDVTAIGGRDDQGECDPRNLDPLCMCGLTAR